MPTRFTQPGTPSSRIRDPGGVSTRFPYFAYGTTQRGYPHHGELAPLLGEPVGRFRTVEAHSIVVPRKAACSNPGCRFVHRMAALVRGHWDLHAEGDLFLVGEDALAALDRLELSGPYVRERVDVIAVDGEQRFSAEAYPAKEPIGWAELVREGMADALDAYSLELAEDITVKPCCASAPGHAGAHDVLDPLDLHR
jgi:gamma-glutamylcyclotransferase (GGCT)/AIG2-like uncharacterized protein YtfP